MRLVLLDRDGVINPATPHYITSAEDWGAADGALEAIVRLNRAGLLVAVCTNQAAIGRGIITEAALEAIHDKMLRQVRAVGGRINAIFHCPHAPQDGCRCRKPRPGMLLDALEHFDVAPADACFVGDNDTDVAAARAAECLPIRIDAEAREPDFPGYADLMAQGGANAPEPRFSSLARAVEWLLA